MRGERKEGEGSERKRGPARLISGALHGEQAESPQTASPSSLLPGLFKSSFSDYPKERRGGGGQVLQ